MKWPTWDEFKEGLNKFEQKLSEYEIKAADGFEKFKNNHPALDALVKTGIVCLPPPINGMVQGFYDNFGENKEDAAKEVFKYLKDIEAKGEQHYNTIISKLSTIETDMAKQDTLLLLKEILISTGSELNTKLDLLKSMNVKLDDLQEGQNQLLANFNNIQESLREQSKFQSKSISLEPKPRFYKGEIKYFKGRKNEIENLTSMLQANTAPISIVGEGGLGKTSLAIKLIHLCENDFELIIPLYFDLLVFYDDFLVEIAERLGLSLEEFQKKSLEHRMEIIMNELYKKNRVLIFVDNYEVVSSKLKNSPCEDEIKINNFLENVPDNTLVFLTSRIKENLTGEVVKNIEGLCAEDGTTLFTELAKKNLRDKINDPKILEIIDLIVTKTGGHPLAIELLARSYKGKGLEELSTMSSTLGIGVTNHRSREERLKSLEACFDYSIKFIAPKILEILLNLTMFKSSFPPKIVKDVLNHDEESLEILYNHSLLKRIEKDEFGDLDRKFWLYDIHPAIRVYLEKKLIERKVDPEKIYEKKLGVKYGYVLSDLRDHFDTEKRGESLRQFLLLSKIEPNDLERFSEFIQDQNVQAQYFGLLGHFFHLVRRNQKSLKYYEKILSMFDLAQFPENLVPILGNYSLLLYSIGNFDQALNFQKNLARIYEDKKDFENAGVANDNIGLMYFRLGNSEFAYTFCKKSIEQLKQTKKESSLANAYLNLGNILRKNEPDKSLESLTKAKIIFEKLGDIHRQSICNNDMARSYLEVNDNQKAIDCLNYALSLAEQQNDSIRIAEIYLFFGIVYINKKDLPMAKKYLAKCFPTFEKEKDIANLLEYHFQIGNIFVNERDLNNAMKSYQTAFNLAKNIGKNIEIARIGIVMATCFATGGYFKESLEYLKVAINISKQLKNTFQLSVCKYSLKFLISELEKQNELELMNEAKKLMTQI